jgi:hypothetical protein
LAVAIIEEANVPPFRANNGLVIGDWCNGRKSRFHKGPKYYVPAGQSLQNRLVNGWLRRPIEREPSLGWRYTPVLFDPPYLDMSGTNSTENWLAIGTLTIEENTGYIRDYTAS